MKVNRIEGSRRQSLGADGAMGVSFFVDIAVLEGK